MVFLSATNEFGCVTAIFGVMLVFSFHQEVDSGPRHSPPGAGRVVKLCGEGQFPELRVLAVYGEDAECFKLTRPWAPVLVCNWHSNCGDCVQFSFSHLLHSGPKCRDMASCKVHWLLQQLLLCLCAASFSKDRGSKAHSPWILGDSDHTTLHSEDSQERQSICQALRSWHLQAYQLHP